MAGVAYPSDAAAGLELGRQVGELFVAHAKTDGSDAEFDPATMPTGTRHLDRRAGRADAGDVEDVGARVGRPVPARPAPGADSPERAAELAEVKDYPRDAHPFTELFFWPQDPAGRPAPDTVPFSSNQVVFYYAPVLHFLWGPELAQKLFEYRWDANPPRAARAYALVSIAGYDATVACWDAKFFYWTARPNQFDPTITTVLPTYPIPDYPSGHADHARRHRRGAGLPLPARRRTSSSRAPRRTPPRASGRASTSAAPARPGSSSAARWERP